MIGLVPVIAVSAALAAPTAAQEKAAIAQVIADMEAAWNRADFRGYMAGFQNPGVMFVSNGRIQRDWQGTLDHYIRDYGGDPARRGTLHFRDLQIDLLAPDAALLVSHYHLERPDHPQEGVNTRLFRKIDGRWVIAMNHVSSYEMHVPAK
ncbi:YybH family protein [Sphingomonas nostoxanthinifaciens]|uniref:YybH family protein n=1 Tax=Sphingomonas nostoxanthinifaciens TaxID=2872652 RepID=UPI001CC1DA5C|nr:nuclear transport factor 2 family protein [Sphingomonas nostoxanthinifaciens]UAK23459.1 nuclear transport factor 2 family protein [Sphingomonas nostoxanthinifaciens]